MNETSPKEELFIDGWVSEKDIKERELDGWVLVNRGFWHEAMQGYLSARFTRKRRK